MIYERNFITNVRDARQAPASKPICCHAVTHLAPEAVETDSGTVETVNAATNFGVIRFKLLERPVNG